MKLFNKFSALIALPFLAMAIVGCTPSRYDLDSDYDVHTSSYDYGPRQPDYYQQPYSQPRTVVERHYYNNSKPSRPIVKKNYYVNNRPVSRTSYSRAISRTSRKR